MSKDMQIQSIWFDLISDYKNLRLLERKIFVSQKLVRNGHCPILKKPGKPKKNDSNLKDFQNPTILEPKFLKFQYSTCFISSQTRRILNLRSTSLEA